MNDREQFEAWMASRNLGAERDGDSYSLTYARRAWEAWQAASAIRAARVAELEAVIRRLRPSNRPPGCWCAPFWDTQRYGHDETCQAAAALLSDKEKS